LIGHPAIGSFGGTLLLHCPSRKKNGKPRRSWSGLESRRCPGGQIVQRHVLYLGEINDSRKAA